MADVKISALPAATTPLTGSEVLPIVQSGATQKVSVDNLTAGRAVSVRSASATENFFSNAGGGVWFNGANSFTVGIASITFDMVFFVNQSERARITTGGEFYIAGTADQGAYNLQVNGTGVWGAGAYVNGSDARIKDDIAPLTSGLDVVAKLKPVQFRYKESWSKDTALQPGFIAQDLQAALTEQPYADGVVLQGPEYMSVAYQALIPLLTKAIQEQQTQIEDLKGRLAVLENR